MQIFHCIVLYCIIHGIGQSIYKSPERPSVRACVRACVRPIFEAPYLHNGARKTHGHKGSPTGSGPPRVEWSRDRRRHVTVKGQGRDPLSLRRQLNFLIVTTGLHGLYCKLSRCIGQTPFLFEQYLVFLKTLKPKNTMRQYFMGHFRDEGFNLSAYGRWNHKNFYALLNW